ncbi:rRNA processing/ribosome biogenesis-domain-containing protein [Lanmaoa asiatica]|nr:rRNA processing/ribosome biogenesis-domain-containing protein [Lanmaoa asiatica]
MDAPNQLQALLQFLVTDASSIAHLSYILDHLSSSCLAPSPHLQKWVTRVTSLMHSKDPAARWAAVCIAYRMSCLSKSLLIDNAQSWVGIVFSSLSKPEPVPILRAATRYLSLVLCAAGHNLEFQRQVAIPIVPKVSSALLTIAEKHNDRDIKILSIRTLAQLVPLYPSLHKALSQRLYALCNQIFSGSVHHTTDGLLDATVNLYAVLHFLGGKVGGTNLWRNCLDEVLQFSWSAWLTLRTTFPTSTQLSHKAIGHLRLSDGKPPNPLSQADATTGNPLTTVALNFDKLKCGVSAIGALLRYFKIVAMRTPLSHQHRRVPVHRPVRVPIGHLAAFCWCLLTSTLDDEGPTHIDPRVRIAESTVVPQIWMQACRLLSYLTQTTQDLLAPHASRLIMIISSHLENNLELSQRNSFLWCAFRLLYSCPVVGATLGINRLLKATISILSPLYLHQPRTETNSGPTSQLRANKKRRREYEVDNVLSATNITVCATTDECDTLIAALDVVNQCMLNAELVPSTRSLADRVLLSILLSLPSIPPSSLSFDPSFHGRVISKVRDMCVESAQGISNAMSRGTGLVLHSLSSENLAKRDKLHSRVDLLLHPRRPPFVRTLPLVESLSLSSAEESAEETATRQSLDLAFGDGDHRSITSELQNHPELVSQSSLAPDQQTSLNPPQERALPTPIKLHPQATNGANGNPPIEVATSSVLPAAPPLPAVPDVPAGSLPLISQKGPVPELVVHVAPMLVDESDHEEVPTIDLGSDSDA